MPAHRLLPIAALAAACLAAATRGSVRQTGNPPAAAAGDTILRENFESGSLASWDDRGHPERHAIVTDAALAHGGRRALRITYPENADGGWLTRFFLPGYDTLWVSYWVKLDEGWRLGTKLIYLFGSRTDDRWSAVGQASRCPSGTDFFRIALIATVRGHPGPLNFYTYHPAMPRQRDGRTCWGGHAGAAYTAPAVLRPGVWHHVEFAVAINQPGRSDARQKFWLDGVAGGEWSGISVRTTADLRLNAFTISASLAGRHPEQRMWVDDIVVARRRPGGW